MADFVELRDGTIINLEHVYRMHPSYKANKLELSYGVSYTFTDEEGEHVRGAIRSRIAKPKPKGRPKKELDI